MVAYIVSGGSADRAGWLTLYLVALQTELDGLHCIVDSGDRAGWLKLYW